MFSLYVAGTLRLRAVHAVAKAPPCHGAPEAPAPLFAPWHSVGCCRSRHYERRHPFDLEDIAIQCLGSLLQLVDGVVFCARDHPPPADGHSLVVQRGIVFLLSVATAGGIFVAIVAAISTLTGTKAQDLPLALQIGVALGIALAFQPLKQWIQNALDRYLYRESYDYRTIIREASRTVASLLNLKSLVEYLCKTVSDTLRPDSVAVFVRDSTQDHLDLVAVQNIFDTEKLPIASSLSASSPLPTFLQHYRRTLLRDDLGSTVTGRDAELAIDQLIALGGEFAIPMMSEADLIGLLIVGPKRSGDAYFSDDLELLSTLSHQAVIAMRNAQLYRQVVLVNEYVENILATMESGVVATDSLRTITLCNKAAERMTGTTAEALRSQGIGKLPDALREPLEATLGMGSHKRNWNRRWSTTRAA